MTNIIVPDFGRISFSETHEIKTLVLGNFFGPSIEKRCSYLFEENKHGFMDKVSSIAL